jgi:hypothetical protein
MSESNQDKSIKGYGFKKTIESILDYSKNQKYIKDYYIGYACGMPGYKEKSQFKAAYLIEFSDNIKWVLFTTTTIRDRVKEQYWEALNIKTIDKSIKAAFIIYPDEISDRERRLAEAKNKKIQSKNEYATVEGIISQDQLSNTIEEYALKNAIRGSALAKKGTAFENKIAFIISNPFNIEKWRTNDENKSGVHYVVFLEIIKMLHLQASDVVSIAATCDASVIGSLPSGGKPKTDVLVTVESKDNMFVFYTISCKRSENERVAVHEYSADEFSRVLDPNNKKLKQLLNHFQECGGPVKFGVENGKKLQDALAPYIEKLSLWALGGYGGGGNEKQCAKYIITYSSTKRKYSFHSTRDYYNELIARDTHGHFGTPFTWTYPSKKFKTKIQLKCELLTD